MTDNEERIAILREAYLSAQAVQTMFLQAEEGEELPFKNLPEDRRSTKWLLRMANEMLGAIDKLIEESEEK